MRVLVIEDSQADIDLYCRMLRRTFSFDVDICYTAKEALDNKNLPDYQLILLDYNLPEMTGVEFLQKVQETEKEIPCPVIILTGQGKEDIVVDFMRLGISDYIQKDSVNTESMVKIIMSALKKFQQQKLEKDKKRELSLFAHTIAHDLKSPLGRARVYSQLARKYPEKCTKYLRSIEEDLMFASQFIDSLLKYAETGRLNTTQDLVDLNKAVQKSVENLEIEACSVNAEINIGDLPKISGSEISLIQLFQNMISNSIKYCIQRPIIEITSKVKKSEVVISISDNGIGIPKEQIEKIFQPFARIPNITQATGSGLGLAAVKAAIDQHEAKIDITSRSEGGTQFDITFPAKGRAIAT